MKKMSSTLAPVVLFVLISSACSTQKTTNKSPHDVPEQIGAAVTAPLSDLNLIKTAIPDVLRNAQTNPYAVPTNISCENLGKEINELNEVLGVDLDTPATKKSDGLLERNLVSESVSSIRRTTESVVPFRNWVRKLSGAERKSNTVKSAITAGSIRRAYLKGFGQANKCPAPAAPQVLTVKD